jgi:hypothetical protein
MGMVVRFHRASSRDRNPNKLGSAEVSAFLSSSEKSKNKSDGILPLRRQLEIADGPTPANCCAVSVPIASITDSTEVRSMPEYSSHAVNVSSVHAMELEVHKLCGTMVPMPLALRTLAKRLEMTQGALNVTGADIYRATGIKANRWSQYVNNKRPITLDAAAKLCDAYGLTLDWIFRADPSKLPADLHKKLTKAESA